MPSVARMMVMVQWKAVTMVVVAQGAYNSSTSLLKNGLASSREKLCECSRPTSRRKAEKVGKEPSYSRAGGGKPGIRKPWPRLRCLDLAWLCTLHAVRIQTDLRGFARQKVRERGSPWRIYIGNACAGRGGTRGITPSRKVGIMAAVQCGCTAAALSRKSSKTSG